MGQDPPKSVRFGDERLGRITAWGEARGLKQHAAILALIDLGLGAPEKSEVPPARLENRSPHFVPRPDTWNPAFAARPRPKK